ncbi:hypothetical protein ACA910_022173 [Epithemia clementina (nom. ined.)]
MVPSVDLLLLVTLLHSSVSTAFTPFPPATHASTVGHLIRLRDGSSKFHQLPNHCRLVGTTAAYAEVVAGRSEDAAEDLNEAATIDNTTNNNKKKTEELLKIVRGDDDDDDDETLSNTGDGVSFTNELTAAVNTDATKTKNPPPFPVVLWKFTRPHTIIGSAFAIPSLHMLAAPTLRAAFSAQALAVMVYAMIPALLMNLYITGLNQITDVEIDKINKPNLPIPAGILSVRNAIITVVISLIASLAMGLLHPVYGTEGLNVALWGSGILGTLYSLPPIRLKRFPVLAAFCIVAVRGAIINASFFAHSAAAAYGGMASATGSSILYCLKNNSACFRSSMFFAVFGLVIALMKDVPDVVGDRRANVRTFSVRIGQNRVFHGMRWLLSGLFFAVGGSFLRSAWIAPTAALTVGRVLTGCSSILAGLSVRKEAQGVNPEDSQQVYDFYMHLWKLFYLSYLALPFAR